MTNGVDVAILAPVPLRHLQSGAEVSARTGFAAFGSLKWELFRNVDAMRGGRGVPMFIYPSHEDDPAKLDYVASWFGWYIGHVESRGGAHPEGMKHRPPTTAAPASDNRGHWAVFWHVEVLYELPPTQRHPISDFESHANGTWRKNAPPRGPELVARPSWID